jgi:cysteine desulfurase / selenocysteine lyase
MNAPQAGQTLAQRWRGEFPLLAREVRGRPLVYLDNGATTQKPRAVIEALSRYYAHHNANVHRGVHTLSEEATALYEGARETVRRFLNAASVNEIVFTRGTTEAINLVAWSYAASTLRPGDVVLLTGMEHHSNIVPWQLLAQRTGIEVAFAAIDRQGALIEEEFLAHLRGGRVKLAAFTHVSNALGTVNPVARLTRAAHAAGAVVLVDGAQAVAHAPVDVRSLGCDFYAFSGHKVFGPTGVGVLYGRSEMLQAMPPWQGGGDMIRTVSLSGSTYADPPYRFEAGTPHIAGAFGLGVALEFLEGVGRAEVAAYEQMLLEHGTRVLADIPRVRPIGTAPQRAAVLSFVVEGIHAHDLGTILDMDGIAIRAGHHCAMPVMEFFGLPATARASLAFYNTPDELDRLGAGLRKALEMLG